MVHGGWGVPAVLGWTSVPLYGERGGCPHVGTFAPFAASLQRKKTDFCFCARCPKTACHHAEVVRMTLHMYPV